VTVQRIIVNRQTGIDLQFTKSTRKYFNFSLRYLSLKKIWIYLNIIDVNLILRLSPERLKKASYIKFSFSKL